MSAATASFFFRSRVQVTGHPAYGLPWGLDRLVPIFLATLAIKQLSRVIRFRNATQLLDTFGMLQGGTQYRRLIGSCQPIFGATIFSGTYTQRERTTVVHGARFNFMTEALIWYTRNSAQDKIVHSEEFFREIMDHRIPTDMEAAKRSRAPRRRSISSLGFPTTVSSPNAANERLRCTNEALDSRSMCCDDPYR